MKEKEQTHTQKLAAQPSVALASLVRLAYHPGGESVPSRLEPQKGASRKSIFSTGKRHEYLFHGDIKSKPGPLSREDVVALYITRWSRASCSAGGHARMTMTWRQRTRNMGC